MYAARSVMKGSFGTAASEDLESEKENNGVIVISKIGIARSATGETSPTSSSSSPSPPTDDTTAATMAASVVGGGDDDGNKLDRLDSCDRGGGLFDGVDDVVDVVDNDVDPTNGDDHLGGDCWDELPPTTTTPRKDADAAVDVSIASSRADLNFSVCSSVDGEVMFQPSAVQRYQLLQRSAKKGAVPTTTATTTTSGGSEDGDGDTSSWLAASMARSPAHRSLQFTPTRVCPLRGPISEGAGGRGRPSPPAAEVVGGGEGDGLAVEMVERARTPDARKGPEGDAVNGDGCHPADDDDDLAFLPDDVAVEELLRNDRKSEDGESGAGKEGQPRRGKTGNGAAPGAAAASAGSSAASGGDDTDGFYSVGSVGDEIDDDEGGGGRGSDGGADENDADASAAAKEEAVSPVANISISRPQCQRAAESTDGGGGGDEGDDDLDNLVIEGGDHGGEDDGSAALAIEVSISRPSIEEEGVVMGDSSSIPPGSDSPRYRERAASASATPPHSREPAPAEASQEGGGPGSEGTGIDIGNPPTPAAGDTGDEEAAGSPEPFAATKNVDAAATIDQRGDLGPSCQYDTGNPSTPAAGDTGDEAAATTTNDKATIDHRADLGLSCQYSPTEHEPKYSEGELSAKIAAAVGEAVASAEERLSRISLEREELAGTASELEDRLSSEVEAVRKEMEDRMRRREVEHGEALARADADARAGAAEVDEEVVSSMEGRIRTLEEAEATMREEHGRQLQALRDEHRSSVDEVVAQLDEIEAEHDARLKGVQTKLNEKETVISVLSAQLVESNATIGALQEEGALRQEAARALEEELAASRERAEGLERSAEAERAEHRCAMEEERVLRRKAVEHASAELRAAAEEQFGEANRHYMRLKKEYELARQELKRVRADAESASKESKSREVSMLAEIAQLKADLATRESDIAAATKRYASEVEEMREAEHKLRAELDESKAVCETGHRSIAHLSRENKELQSMAEELMEMVEKKNLPLK